MFTLVKVWWLSRTLEDIYAPSEGRVRAAVALGALGSRRAVPALVRTLRDVREADYDVRAACAHALGQLGDDAAVEPLTTARDDDTYTQVRQAAAAALVALGEPNGRLDPLVAELRALYPVASDTEPDPGPDDEDSDEEEASRPPLELLEQGRGWERIDAAKALGEQRCREAVPALVRVLGDREVWLRDAATEALGRIGDTRALEPLGERLRDADPMVRCTAAAALAECRDARAIPVLQQAMADPDEDVRESVADALTSLTRQTQT